jgi:hypothetical protein
MAGMNTTQSIYQEADSSRFAELAKVDVSWIWEGYLARGATTLLTSQWKAGKTTLLSVLLKRLAMGEPLAGLATAKTKVAVVSEERLESWRRRHEQLQFGDNLTFLCRPLSSRPTRETWHDLVDRLAQLGSERGIELVVIDPLAQFLPGAVENQSSAILDALQPFDRLTAAGQSVLLLHHPRKAESAPGNSSRGSGALCAAVDLLVEMKLPAGGSPNDRRRRLLAWSRYDETPRERVIELLPDGSDYVECQIEEPEDRQDYIGMIEHLLSCPPRKLSRMQLLNAWPKKMPTPNPVTLWRAIEGAVKLGKLEQEGTGRKGDPLRYSIPGLGATWFPDISELLDLPNLR